MIDSRGTAGTADEVPALLVDKLTAARMLCCCPNTIDNLRRQGDLRAVRLSNNPKAGVRFRIPDLEALVAARLEGGINDTPQVATSSDSNDNATKQKPYGKAMKGMN